MAAMEGCIFISKDPRLFESSVPMPKGDFPRANHETSLHIIAAPPYASDEADRDCLWAARKASTTWRKAIDQAAKLAGITFYDAYAPIDDTGFALAVLDKVCEL